MKRIPSRLIILISIILCHPYAMASNRPITDGMAEQYFKNCIDGATKDATMTPVTRKAYCACTAMNMQRSMSQEDLSNLQNRDQSGRNAINKVLIDVNGPCMEYPAHDLIHKKCMTDVGNPSTCNCLSKNMGKFVAKISGKMLPQLLRNDPNLYDPLSPIMNTPEFKREEQRIVLTCATQSLQTQSR